MRSPLVIPRERKPRLMWFFVTMVFSDTLFLLSARGVHAVGVLAGAHPLNLVLEVLIHSPDDLGEGLPADARGGVEALPVSVEKAEGRALSDQLDDAAGLA